MVGLGLYGSWRFRHYSPYFPAQQRLEVAIIQILLTITANSTFDRSVWQKLKSKPIVRSDAAALDDTFAATEENNTRELLSDGELESVRPSVEKNYGPAPGLWQSVAGRTGFDNLKISRAGQCRTGFKHLKMHAHRAGWADCHGSGLKKRRPVDAIGRRMSDALFLQELMLLRPVDAPHVLPSWWFSSPPTRDVPHKNKKRGRGSFRCGERGLGLIGSIGCIGLIGFTGFVGLISLIGVIGLIQTRATVEVIKQSLAHFMF